ncbi:MAG: PQQ-binding-like beta-propeller repeat protein [Actinophytocola sp.]|uniref:outer membrane protein assembly factor BamB family protein n=1 Tax=Actinophytocola sp. TaxID=1872138 RepID=UPI0013225C45|nr:PQQ-binding-like beta-propeller repeat protein [Actinophytocola sp.]MPZ83015.1 PQQ-binding-like beta-propeller repeat protein [Actinophytocola sp.]
MNSTMVRAVGALVLVAAAAVVVVATGDPPEDKPEPPPTVPPTAMAAPAPLLGDSSDWSRLGALAAPERLAVRDGAVLMVLNGELTLVDIESGDPRWTVRTGAALRGATETYDGAGLLIGDGVLVTYRTGGRAGVARLSTADGAVQWRRELGARVELETADDRVVLVVVDAARVVALDVTAGRPYWARTGLWPHAVAGDVVVGETVRNEQRTGRPTEGTVAAWDLATGEPRWTLADLDPARVTLTAGDVVLVEGFPAAGPKIPTTWVVDAGTGRRLTALGTAPLEDNCATDGRTLIACSVLESSGSLDIDAFWVEDREVETLNGDFTSHAVYLVGPSLIVAGDSKHYVAIDRGGRLIARNLPYRPVAITGEYLLTSTSQAPLLEVFRLRT